MAASCFSTWPAQPRLAAGLAGLGMQDLPRLEGAVAEGGAGAVPAEAADPEDERRRHVSGDLPQGAVAGGEQGIALGRGQLVGGAVAAALLEEGERAVVPDEEAVEEAVRAAEAVPRPPPETASADLAAPAVEPLDRPPGVLGAGPSHPAVDAEPVPDQLDLAERDPGLHHAPGPGVHADQQHLGPFAAVAFEVGGVRFERVGQRIVHVRHRGREAQPPRNAAEGAGNGHRGGMRRHSLNTASISPLMYPMA